ncbi:hypothetical protein B0I35DRAFT_53586 [Stachybotrys elegans]|uniref:Uncharacterized protein n=1 Tax=Stachybotrys elegans TaxID=80388 RepID=A0A8K0SM45_9HYPO|nr:hypothetical protein B0I35DRAFT_53586 [Stachybotrys elegans]
MGCILAQSLPEAPLISGCPPILGLGMACCDSSHWQGLSLAAAVGKTGPGRLTFALLHPPCSIPGRPIQSHTQHPAPSSRGWSGITIALLFTNAQQPLQLAFSAVRIASDFASFCRGIRMLLTVISQVHNGVHTYWLQTLPVAELPPYLPNTGRTATTKHSPARALAPPLKAWTTPPVRSTSHTSFGYFSHRQSLHVREPDLIEHPESYELVHRVPLATKAESARHEISKICLGNSVMLPPVTPLLLPCQDPAFPLHIGLCRRQ